MPLAICRAREVQSKKVETRLKTYTGTSLGVFVSLGSELVATRRPYLHLPLVEHVPVNVVVIHADEQRRVVHIAGVRTEEVVGAGPHQETKRVDGGHAHSLVVHGIGGLGVVDGPCGESEFSEVSLDVENGTLFHLAEATQYLAIGPDSVLHGKPELDEKHQPWVEEIDKSD
jgi:hypothetical protein